MLRLKKCACSPIALERSPRSLWMRLFTSRRLYLCASCNDKVFGNQKEIDALVQRQLLSTWKGMKAQAMANANPSLE